jgi:hypothetical protein
VSTFITPSVWLKQRRRRRSCRCGWVRVEQRRRRSLKHGSRGGWVRVERRRRSNGLKLRRLLPHQLEWRGAGLDEAGLPLCVYSHTAATLLRLVIGLLLLSGLA